MFLTLVLFLSTLLHAPAIPREAAYTGWNHVRPELAAEWTSGGLRSISLIGNVETTSVGSAGSWSADSYPAGFSLKANLASVMSSRIGETKSVSGLPSHTSTESSSNLLLGGRSLSESTSVVLSGRRLTGGADSGTDDNESRSPGEALDNGSDADGGHLYLHFTHAITTGLSGSFGSFSVASLSSSSSGGGSSGGIGGGVGNPTGGGGGVVGGLPGNGEGGGRPRATPEPSCLTALTLLGVALSHRPKRRK